MGHDDNHHQAFVTLAPTLFCILYLSLALGPWRSSVFYCCSLINDQTQGVLCRVPINCWAGSCSNRPGWTSNSCDRSKVYKCCCRHHPATHHYYHHHQLCIELSNPSPSVGHKPLPYISTILGHVLLFSSCIQTC